MYNDFTINQVRKFWDEASTIYDQTNKKIGAAHYQRFTESLKYLDLQANQLVLNIWSRTGNAIPHIRRVAKVELYNLEASEKMLAIAKNKFPEENFKITDLEKLAFPDNFFDRILSLETLEHTPNPLMLLKEFFRVLKPNGILVMSLPPKTAELPLMLYDIFFDNHGEGPHKFLSSKNVKKMLQQSGLKLKVHKGTLLFPAGPQSLQLAAEKIIEFMQKTPIKELGIRQFYVCEKTQ